jgi:hypothetical protein
MARISDCTVRAARRLKDKGMMPAIVNRPGMTILGNLGPSLRYIPVNNQIGKSKLENGRELLDIVAEQTVLSACLQFLQLGCRKPHRQLRIWYITTIP